MITFILQIVILRPLPPTQSILKTSSFHIFEIFQEEGILIQAYSFNYNSIGYL